MGEGRQDGGGELGRAGRRCCRRLRSRRLWFFKLSSPERICSGVGSGGESKSTPYPFSASTLLLSDSLPLPPSSGGRAGPGSGGGVGGGRHLTLAWGLPRRPLRCAPRGLRGHGPGGGPAALASSARQRRALRSPRVGLSGPEGALSGVGDTSFKRGVSVCGRRLRLCLGRPLWFRG